MPILPDSPNSVICHKDAARACRGKRQGSNWGPDLRARGGCRYRTVGRRSAQIPLGKRESRGCSGDGVLRFRRGRTRIGRRWGNSGTGEESISQEGSDRGYGGGYGGGVHVNASRTRRRPRSRREVRRTPRTWPRARRRSAATVRAHLREVLTQAGPSHTGPVRARSTPVTRANRATGAKPVGPAKPTAAGRGSQATDEPSNLTGAPGPRNWWGRPSVDEPRSPHGATPDQNIRPVAGAGGGTDGRRSPPINFEDPGRRGRGLPGRRGDPSPRFSGPAREPTHGHRALCQREGFHRPSDESPRPRFSATLRPQRARLRGRLRTRGSGKVWQVHRVRRQSVRSSRSAISLMKRDGSLSSPPSASRAMP